MVSILVGDDLLLRSYSAEDALLLYTAIDQSREHLRPWLMWVDRTTKPEHSLQFILQSLQEQHNQESMALGIFHQQKIIGAIGMQRWDHQTQRASIGYWIAKDYEGTGVLSRCLVRFIDFLFLQVGLHKVEIHFLPANSRSGKVAARLNFKTEGIIRHHTLHHGKLEDIVITGLLKEEWVGTQQ